ncbi:hypothetical protein DV736_g3635, partial [Chaetothyriales sp. CBS 134916]
MSTGFSFGAPNAGSPTTTAASSVSLFSSATAPSSNLFGSGSGALSFGSTGNASSASGSEQKPFFAPAAASGAPSSNVFASPKPTPPSQSALASSTPAPAASTAQFSFGNASTTPAGPPPSASTFAASTGGSSAPLFGAASKSSTPAFSFGKPVESDATASSTAPSSQPQTSGGLFSSTVPTSTFSFGQKPTDKPSESGKPAPAAAPTAKAAFAFATATSSAKPASTSAPGASLFGNIAASAADAPRAPLFAGISSTQPSQSTSSQPTNSNLFGTPSSPAASSPAPKPAFSFPSAASQPASSAPATTSAAPTPLFASAPAFTGFGTTTATAPATAWADPKLAASTSGPPPQLQSRLKNKTMDEILTRWATDLTKYTKEFKNDADTIAKWDQTIVDNTAKIDKLYVKTRTCEKQTMSVDMQLSAVENQQSELEAWLTKYENEVEEMQAKDNANPAELGGPDQERERTYKLAEKLQERLDDMSRDLETMVEEVNAANASLHKNGKADEPITQIVRILNTHLSQLQVIDQGTAALQKKMADSQKAAHGLAYLPGANSEARAAVDDFYRSYIGRQ